MTPTDEGQQEFDESSNEEVEVSVDYSNSQGLKRRKHLQMTA